MVWWGEDDADGLTGDELEIFGHRLAADGREIGKDDFRVSRAGADGDPRFAALVPSVAYRSADRRYVVAWYADTGELPLEDNELEIYVAAVPEGGLDAPTAGVRVSHMGPDGECLFAAVDPALAYDSRHESFLVAWLGDEPGPPLADNDFEIFVRRVGRRPRPRASYADRSGSAPDGGVTAPAKGTRGPGSPGPPVSVAHSSSSCPSRAARSTRMSAPG